MNHKQFDFNFFMGGAAMKKQVLKLTPAEIKAAQLFLLIAKVKQSERKENKEAK